MQYATLDGHKSMPSHTGQRAECPICGGEVLSKCGNVNIHHWAHISGEDCDPWSEPETEWHREWKNQFPFECREVTIQGDGESHRADVCLPNGMVLEFQHSTLKPDDIRKREEFYSKYTNGMVWVVDGTEFMDRWVKYKWSQWEHESYLKGKKPSWFFDYSPFNYIYSEDYSGFDLESDGSLPKESFPFLKPVRWPNARKRWVYAHAPLYFDSGERNNKPEKELIHESFTWETYTHQEPKELRYLNKGESQYRYTEKMRKRYLTTEKKYQESDIFEWLGTVNDGSSTKSKYYDKLLFGYKSRINGRGAFHLPKYIVGRFRPFNDVLTELSSSC